MILKPPKLDRVNIIYEIEYVNIFHYSYLINNCVSCSEGFSLKYQKYYLKKVIKL